MCRSRHQQLTFTVYLLMADYDDSYNRALSPPISFGGDTNCSTVVSSASKDVMMGPSLSLGTNQRSWVRFRVRQSFADGEKRRFWKGSRHRLLLNSHMQDLGF